MAGWQSRAEPTQKWWVGSPTRGVVTVQGSRSGGGGDFIWGHPFYYIHTLYISNIRLLPSFAVDVDHPKSVSQSQGSEGVPRLSAVLSD